MTIRIEQLRISRLEFPHDRVPAYASGLEFYLLTDAKTHPELS
jgi:hypothetical protein